MLAAAAHREIEFLIQIIFKKKMIPIYFQKLFLFMQNQMNNVSLTVSCLIKQNSELNFDVCK